MGQKTIVQPSGTVIGVTSVLRKKTRYSLIRRRNKMFRKTLVTPATAPDETIVLKLRPPWTPRAHREQNDTKQNKRVFVPK